MNGTEKIYDSKRGKGGKGSYAMTRKNILDYIYQVQRNEEEA
jgi:hypothetical protein